MVSIVIQSGGKSSRMGTEKGLVSFCGKPLIVTVINQIKNIGDEVIIITNKPTIYEFTKMKLAQDLIKDYGPLAGLQSALFHALHPIVVNLACDIPFVNVSLLQYMIEILINNPNLDVVIPKIDLGFEPMQAVYRKTTCLPKIDQAINHGKRRMISWFDQVSVMAITEEKLRYFDPDLRCLININSKEDLEIAEHNYGCLKFNP